MPQGNPDGIPEHIPEGIQEEYREESLRNSWGIYVGTPGEILTKNTRKINEVIPVVKKLKS